MSGKTKKRRRKIYVNMGDTVKLNKGRIGLIRFIGKTQFGLGEWIGIELYNELLRTRHNGAVLGKRYFRCPPHRGVFVRRTIIKENIAVLDIQKSINKLRTKEKKLKDERKKKLKKEKAARKVKNDERRQSKRQKLQAKYANSPHPKYNQNINNETEHKVDKIEKKIKEIKEMKETKEIMEKPSINNKKNANKELPASLNTNTRRKKNSLPENNKKKKRRKKRNSNSKKRNSNSNKKEEITTANPYFDEIDDSDDEFPLIATNEFATAQPLVIKTYIEKSNIKKDKKQHKRTRSKKSKSTESKKKKRNSSSATPSKSPILKTSTSSPVTPRSSPYDHELSEQSSIPSRYSLSSARSKSTGDNIAMDQEDMNGSSNKNNNNIMNGSSNEILPPENSMAKSKVSVHSYDGALQSDDSLNESEEDDDSVLRKELEEDFEQNYDESYKVLDEYTHTIDDIETGRKKLANKLVEETKQRKKKSKSKSKRKSGNKKALGLNARRTNKELFRDRIVNDRERKRLNQRINPNLMLATMRNKKSKKKFDSARSRRGSSFVDDYNLNDTLFFDGDEETTTVTDNDKFYVDDMGSDDEDNNEQQNNNNVIHTIDTIKEDKKEDEYDDDITEAETETEMIDPLLGTIEDDDATEYEEEEMKIFDIIQQKDENKKVVIFYTELREFLQWESAENGYGMKISKINENEYGNALVEETGINDEWKVCIINGNDITEMMNADVVLQIKKCDKQIENGYSLTFKKFEKDLQAKNNMNLKPSVYMKSKKKVND